MSRKTDTLAEKRIRAALLLSDSGEYADALIVLLEAVNLQRDAVYAEAALRKDLALQANDDEMRIFAGSAFFRINFATLSDRISSCIARAGAAQHRVGRKEFLDIFEDIRMFFQDAGRYAAGREPAGATPSGPAGRAALVLELMKLADRKLGSASLLCEAKKYEECLLVLCEAIKIKLRSLLRARLDSVPDGDPFALFSVHFSPERDALLQGSSFCVVSRLKALCAESPGQRTIDGKTCRKLLDDAAAFFGQADKAARNLLPADTRGSAGSRARTAAVWLAGAAVAAAVLWLFAGINRQPDGGLTGTYFRGTDLSRENIVFQRKDPGIDFSWSAGAPDLRMPNTRFSVRWTGTFLADKDREYNFYTISDDGVRLWVKNIPVIDNWRIQGPTESTGKIFLKKGWHAIRLEYFQNQGDAAIRLLWDGSFLIHTVIPPGHFKP